MLQLSLILCCHNGIERLKPTIEHLVLQILPDDFRWEFIFVDNASTDGSAQYVTKLWNEYKGKGDLRIVEEKKAGLIYARQAGVKNAKGEIIIFCDDDNWLDAHYLYKAYEIMVLYPNIGVLGGRGIGITDNNISLPDWWELNGNCNNFAVGKQLSSSAIANRRCYIWGAGLTSRKSILDKVFDERFPFLMTGRMGNIVLSGEDSEICARVRILGYDLFYDEDLKYKHYMPTNRLTKEYLNCLIISFENVHDMQIEYNAAVTYLNMNYIKKISLFFVRYFNRVFKYNNKRKRVLFRQYNAYALGMRSFVPKEYSVIFDFIKKYH